MKRQLLLFLIVPLLLAGCTKCVECEVKLKQSQDIIATVEEFCGSTKKVEGEEERLRADYTCIECNVLTNSGVVNSDIECGDRSFTDSIQAGWEQAAFDIGREANCIYYRDTANVTCVLKQ
ncbi:MAG: hypothetical protein ACI9UR_000293 [Bacteroidia bacterium]|jgi:hypothetical protein